MYEYPYRTLKISMMRATKADIIIVKDYLRICLVASWYFEHITFHYVSWISSRDWFWYSSMHELAQNLQHECTHMENYVCIISWKIELNQDTPLIVVNHAQGCLFYLQHYMSHFLLCCLALLTRCKSRFFFNIYLCSTIHWRTWHTKYIPCLGFRGSVMTRMSGYCCWFVALLEKSLVTDIRHKSFW